MSARPGMTYLIQRWRWLVNDREASTFSDDDVQELLDRFAERYVGVEMVPIPQVEDGDLAVRVYAVPIQDCEGPESGADRWRVYDGNGDTLPTDQYTAHPERGEIELAQSQSAVLFLDCYAYDVYAAAAEGWRMLAAKAAEGVGFSDHSVGIAFNMSERFDHCMRMAEAMDRLSHSLRRPRPKASRIAIDRAGT